MRLEAIAALLGHRTLRMTIRYARIANRTVADEYQAVSRPRSKPSTRSPRLGADAEGPTMRRVRAEHHRMLGNGWCTRPAELDCSFEAICEGCGFFATTVEFKPTLQRQADHAAAHDQPDRATIYRRVIDALDEDRVMTALDDPRRRYPSEPVCDDDTEHVLRAAVDTLVSARSPMWHGDAGAVLHALASLAARDQPEPPRRRRRRPRPGPTAGPRSPSSSDARSARSSADMPPTPRHGGRPSTSTDRATHGDRPGAATTRPITGISRNYLTRSPA